MQSRSNSSTTYFFWIYSVLLNLFLFFLFFLLKQEDSLKILILLEAQRNEWGRFIFVLTLKCLPFWAEIATGSVQCLGCSFQTWAKQQLWPSSGWTFSDRSCKPCLFTVVCKRCASEVGFQPLNHLYLGRKEHHNANAIPSSCVQSKVRTRWAVALWPTCMSKCVWKQLGDTGCKSQTKQGNELASFLCAVGCQGGCCAFLIIKYCC